MSTPASFFVKLRQPVFGAPLNPLAPQTRQHIALIAFLAWMGLGADGLSSSAYGPEQSFIALGEHTELGLYLALAAALTVFIIANAYTQVIELFPTVRIASACNTAGRKKMIPHRAGHSHRRWSFAPR